MAKGYSKKQTGTPSKYGAAKSGGNRTVNPWGKNVAHKSATKSNALGQNPSKGRKPAGTSRKRPTADASLRSMDYKPNDPRTWPVVPSVALGQHGRPSPTAPTAANATRENAITNTAYKRGGYPEP